jgi:hypothetical protein
MSTIYNDLYQDLEPTRFIRGSTPDLCRFEAGLSLELMLEEGLIRRLGGERPPEQMTDCGIAYSPDLLIFENGKVIVGEIKATWLSSKDVPHEVANNLPPKFSKYLTQMKAYAYHLGTVHGRLLVYFVNGNYKPMAPQLLCWDIEFSPQEIDECWSMLKNHARHKGFI